MLTDVLNGTIVKKPPRLLKERAYEGIKQRLLNEEYKPGSFLSERSLADQLGMSKTPVKAALERLESEGFISVSPQQGIVVRETSVREIADVYEIRAALEAYALRTLAGKITPADVKRVEQNLADQKKLLNQLNVDLGVRLDSEFHALFIGFLGNREFVMVFEKLREKMERVIRSVFRISPSRMTKSFQEHTAIAEAAIAGHGDKAAQAIVDHLDRGKRLIVAPLVTE
jgi:DNA-binding GntR family transcriptional regulator